jgi:hypothetical protein
VVTVDLNPWLQEDRARQTLAALGPHLPAIARRLRVPLADLQDRYESVPKKADLFRLLRALRIEYRCPFDARQTGFAESCFDAVVSTNVLEHIPADVLRDIHRESNRLLRPGGVAAHRIDVGDHYSIDDRSITKANFQRYSAARWRWYGGSGLAFHNRLRCPEHVALLEEVGFSIVKASVRTDAASIAAIESGAIPVDNSFRDFTPEQLAADYLWVVAVRPRQPDLAPGAG